MITNEAEIRVALQAVLASVLAVYGFWGCAFLVVLVLLPWRPICAAAFYLAQPLVDWRLRKAHREIASTPLERKLDGARRPPKEPSAASLANAVPAKEPAALSPSHPPVCSPPAPFQPNYPAQASFQDLTGNARSLAATLAIPPAIREHVRNLPQGAFSNMDLEVEEVRFHGDTAEAYVKFQSPNVAGLAIRQRYVMRKHRDNWQVESRQPANGNGKVPPPPTPPTSVAMRFT